MMSGELEESSCDDGRKLHTVKHIDSEKSAKTLLWSYNWG